MNSSRTEILDRGRVRAAELYNHSAWDTGHDSNKDTETRWQWMAGRAFVCLLTGLAGWWFHEDYSPVSTAFYMVAYLSGGWDLAKDTWTDFKHIRFDTHFLMLLVVPGAIAVGAWGEGALLLFLFSASSAMEAFANGRTHREIRGLLGRAPKTARVVDGHEERDEQVGSIQPGQTVRITSGEQIPLDCDVLEGESACDESTLTGEAEAIPKRRGDPIFAGTLNLWGVLVARVTRPASDSALERIIRLIESSQKLKAPTQRFTDRFGTGYTAFVVLACSALFLWRWKGKGMPALFSAEGETSAFYQAMTLLVVLSPCALVLSVPSAILSAIAFGARHGVLFRGGSAIEQLGGIRTVAMDKTGTLTEGKLQVLAIEPVHGSSDDVFQLAASIAMLSNHPVSRSIAQEARRRNVRSVQLGEIENVPGKGVRAIRDGMRFFLGNRDLLPPDAFDNSDPKELSAPMDNTTEVWVAGPGVLGRILLRDQLRPQARDLISQLHRDGVRTVMLTGDRATAAERMARECGIDEVLSALKPAEKVEAIQRLKDGGASVVMIGDGVNDAPCIAAADIGVAMGARGSDAAIEQAEVVLMHDRLENFIVARNLSRRSRRIIKQNLAISLGTMVVMVMVALGFSALPLSVGVAAHEGSTVLVVLNSLRLLFTPSAPKK